MKCNREMMKLYGVTDRSWLGARTLYEQVEAAIKGGATIIQLREKKMPEEEFLQEARELKMLCNAYKIPFIINDNISVALAMDADGVHLGQGDMELKQAREILGPDKIIGVSAHNVEEAVQAEKNGADYLGAGAVFSTASKADVTSLSMESLKEICEAVSIPVVAIGGISEENMDQLKGTGISGVAVISALFAQADVCQAATRLCEKLSYIIEKGKKRKTALTIAGSDSSGGAGIQADIKTMIANGVYAMSAITALTAQNTLGVSGIMEVTPEFLGQQMDCIFTDIRPDAVKIGMVSSGELISVIAEKLIQYQAENIVVDPVMVSTSGFRLISEEAVEMLKKKLLPLATVLTPNIPEAQVLLGTEIKTPEDMERSAKKIGEKYHCAVLLKGGHQLNDANDYLWQAGQGRWFMGKRIHNPNTHGTGCTLSSAIASNLAKGYSLETSVQKAKEYLSGALQAMLNLGAGSGPMDHGFGIWE